MDAGIMNYRLQPTKNLAGELRMPGDKSISHRALLLGALAEGTTTIKNILTGEDVLATAAALHQLGISIERNETAWKIFGGAHQWRSPKQPLNLGNSGTSMRLLAGCLAGLNIPATLIGDASLSKRPMARVAEPLRAMGANIRLSDQQTAPIILEKHQGLHGIHYTCPVASAQVKSAILLAGLFSKGDTFIRERAVTRDHSERMLESFGVQVSKNKGCIQLQGLQKLQACELTIPGDISSAAFFMVAASITPNSDILLREVGINLTRSGIITLLKMMGADIEILHLRNFQKEPVADLRIRSAPLRGIVVPENLIANVIDELPIFLVAAANAEGVSVLRGASELRHKESDRLAAMSKGFKVLGIQHEFLEDGMIVTGGKYQGGRIQSFGDHRIAMAFSVAACQASSEMILEDVANVATSFPNFLELANQIGMEISVCDSI